MWVGGAVGVGRVKVWSEGSIGASDRDLGLEMAVAGASGIWGSRRGGYDV
jgi:hypothetical protein